MELDKKKKGVLILSVAGILAGIALIVFLMTYKPSDKGDVVAESANVVSVIPEAETVSTPESKRRAYELGGNSSVEDYWADISGERDAEDGYESEGTVSSRGGITKVDPDKMLEETNRRVEEEQKARQAEEERRRREQDEYMRRYYERQERALDRYVNQAAAQPQSQPEPVKEPEPESVVEERDKIDVEQVKVTRSSGVSSMDDSFSDGSGVSSWDDEGASVDDAYPFKCMFVKQEKLRSGERVTVRILEDMMIDGQLVPANTHVMATCTIGSRIDLNVSSLEYRGRILSLDYDAYDNDGVKGIYAPDLENSQVMEQLKNLGISSGMRTMRSRAGQYVQDILQAGQMVISGSGKERAVYVPAGYQFYLVKSKKLRK